MKVSRARVQAQSRNIAALAASARNAVANGLPNTQDVPAFMRQVTEAYSTMSASVTAVFYTDIRRASGVRKRYTPRPYSAYDAGKVTAATNAVLEEFKLGTATVSLESLLADIVGRYIKDSADECVHENARYDPSKPKYAIVPNGDACAFCQMRASLGYTYPDEQSVESHDHCTCTATPVFGNSTVQGYNPREYQDKYDRAAEAYRSGDYSDDMAARIDAARERHEERYERGETDKKWDSSNAILMIMREQQGIS